MKEFSGKTVLCIVGPSGSGKSHLQNKLMETGIFGRFCSTTTRPIREGERHGVDYYFVSENDFAEDLVEGRFVQTVNFGGGSCYGVTAREMERAFAANDIGCVVVEPSGITQYEEAAEKFGFRVLTLFVTNPTSVLLERFLSRLKNDSEADVKNYTKRLKHLIEVELGWFYEVEPDFVLERYDEANGDVVIEMICNWAMQRSVGFVTKHIRDKNVGVVQRGVLNLS